jgi:hypothetical protein
MQTENWAEIPCLFVSIVIMRKRMVLRPVSRDDRNQA